MLHPEKVLFPDDGITKQELAQYYTKVASFLLPHIHDRLLVLHRFPNGIHQEGFYQREISHHAPSWVERATVADKQGDTTTSIICNTLDTLHYLVNQDTVEFHPWLSRRQAPDCPDRLVFDIDPSRNNFHDVQSAALMLKDILDQRGLVPFVQTTGSRGVHVVVPLDGRHSFRVVRAFAKEVARKATEQRPDLLTIETRVAKREGKVFIDVARNAYAQSAVAPYCVRAKKGAPVSTPIGWEELKRPSMHAQYYTIHTVLARMKTHADPWQSMNVSIRPL